jgi:hypothetical protein
VGDVTRSCAFASDVIEGGGSARRAQLRSVATLFGAQTPPIESPGELVGCMPLGKLAIAIAMPTSRRRK